MQNIYVIIKIIISKWNYVALVFYLIFLFRKKIWKIYFEYDIFMCINWNIWKLLLYIYVYIYWKTKTQARLSKSFKFIYMYRLLTAYIMWSIIIILSKMFINISHKRIKLITNKTIKCLNEFQLKFLLLCFYFILIESKIKVYFLFF